MIGDDENWGSGSYQEDEDGFEIVDPEEGKPEIPTPPEDPTGDNRYWD